MGLIRLIIFIGLLYLGYRLFKSWLLHAGVSQNRRTRGQGKMSEIDDIMVKDPVCNVYIPKREGIHLHRHNEDLYFCSRECRDKYINRSNETGNETGGNNE